MYTQITGRGVGKWHEKVLGVTEHGMRREQSTGRAVSNSSISGALGGQRCEQRPNSTESWRGAVGTLWAVKSSKGSGAQGTHQ